MVQNIFKSEMYLINSVKTRTKYCVIELLYTLFSQLWSCRHSFSCTVTINIYIYFGTVILPTNNYTLYTVSLYHWSSESSETTFKLYILRLNVTIFFFIYNENKRIKPQN